MSRTISIGAQDFGQLRENQCFYVDKTAFIREWWERRDIVTLITRPRRFGKTLNMNMLDYFFSSRHPKRADLFEDLEIWKDEKYRALQGTFPVISLSFAGIKADNFPDALAGIKKLLTGLFSQFPELYRFDGFDENERIALNSIREAMNPIDAVYALNLLSALLAKIHGKKVLIFLDEYDTPLQEAYVHGYWDELVTFTRNMFNNTFKTNPYLERGLMTGITRVSKESIFSDLNNLNVVTTTSDEYATCFGFTEKEVFSAMDEQGIPESEKAAVKEWYDGFIFGRVRDIYNPWSVTMYLDKKKLDTYWANTSGNGLVSKLIQEGDVGLKQDFENLLNGGCVEAEIDEQISFSQLTGNQNAIWSLLLASGYLKVEAVLQETPADPMLYQMVLTNLEVRLMFNRMVKAWFQNGYDFDRFVSAMLNGDEETMNYYIERVTLNTFSSFDTGGQPGERKEPERFYHGFVLGLLADRVRTHILKSNRESGFGRYDVILEPKNPNDTAVIMEFKVRNARKGEKTLEDTAQNALKQIEEKHYDADLLQRGIPSERILKYGFAFEGEQCLILKA
jgi:hypothetical protein